MTEGTGTVSGSVLIPTNLSHTSFVTVVIVQSYWVFELEKSEFQFHSSTYFQK